MKPFDSTEGTHCAYYVIYETHAAGGAKVKAVRGWLFEEAKA